MGTLQKFKFFTMQCAAVSASPARSPTTSPVVRLRRRRSLRMLLNRSGRDVREPPSRTIYDHRNLAPHRETVEKNEDLLSRSLKDLFVASKPPIIAEDEPVKKVKNRLSAEGEFLLFPSARARLGPGSPRLGFLGFKNRLRLLKRAWRPTLVTIPE